MNVVLQQISNILCTYYTPTHHSMYPIRQMGVYGNRVHFKERKKAITYDDKKQFISSTKQPQNYIFCFWYEMT